MYNERAIFKWLDFHVQTMFTTVDFLGNYSLHFLYYLHTNW